MRLINELRERLNGYLGYDKRRIDCFVNMMLALVMAQTVNLKRLAEFMFSDAKVDSRYRRLQRFFSGFRFDFNALAKLIFHLFKFHVGSHYLILDRTNWKLGKKDINVLFLCIAYKKVAIPIFWLMLNKKGNSSTWERAALIERFISVFGKANIAGLLGDREFIGEKWFGYLKRQEIPFYFRVKKDADTTNVNGKSIAIGWLFHGLRKHEPVLIKTARKVYGHKLYIVGMRIDGDYLIVVSNKKPETDDEAMKIYAIRWEIETLFGCLKTKGFNFEDTCITERARIKKLIALLALTFCWAHLVGEWRHQFEKVIPLKKHGRPQHNCFRYGLNWLVDKLYRRGQQLRVICRLFLQIFEPPNIICPVTG